MTVQEMVQGNQQLFVNFAKWLKTVKAEFVNKEPGMQMVIPGYRAIVQWVKDRMSQEIYARVRQQILITANATMINATANATSSGG